MKLKLYVHLPDHALQYLKPEDLEDPEKVVQHCHFTTRESFLGYPLIGEVEAEVELIPKDQIIQGSVLMLRNKAAKLRDDARKEAAQFDSAAEKLLALPMSKPVSLKK